MIRCNVCLPVYACFDSPRACQKRELEAVAEAPSTMAEAVRVTRKLKPATEDWDGAAVDQAVESLRLALKALKDAECPKAAEKVRVALRSALGAQRHVQRRIRASNPGS